MNVLSLAVGGASEALLGTPSPCGAVDEGESFDDAIDYLAHRLRAEGVEQGARVALLMLDDFHSDVAARALEVIAASPTVLDEDEEVSLLAERLVNVRAAYVLAHLALDDVLAGVVVEMPSAGDTIPMMLAGEYALVRL